MNEPLAIALSAGLLGVVGIIVGAILTQFFASRIKARELDSAEGIKRFELAVKESSDLRGSLERQVKETDDLRLQLHQCREDHLIQSQALLDMRREVSMTNSRLLLLENDNRGLRQDLNRYRRGGNWQDDDSGGGPRA